MQQANQSQYLQVEYQMLYPAPSMQRLNDESSDTPYDNLHLYNLHH